MEGVAFEYVPNSIDPGSNENFEYNSYISDNNKHDACDSHAHMFHLLKKSLNQEYYCLVCQHYGKTQMVVPSNICVLCIYI